MLRAALCRATMVASVAGTPTGVRPGSVGNQVEPEPSFREGARAVPRPTGSSGPTLFEYALMAALVALLVVGVLVLIRHQYGQAIHDLLTTLVP